MEYELEAIGTQKPKEKEPPIQAESDLEFYYVCPECGKRLTEKGVIDSYWVECECGYSYA